MVRAFISYSHRDRRLARDVKDCLDEYGLRVFLAHDDLKPSVTWAGVIQAELRQCDVLLPLLTEQFAASQWTDQETGVALALDKLIVPLSVDILPYGFLGAIQAVKLNPDHPRTACRHVVSAIVEQRADCRTRFLDGFIPKFADSGSFDRAGRNATILMECDGYSAEQIQQVLRAIVHNRQIYQSGSARGHLNAFIKKYGKADPALARKAKRAMDG